MRWRLSKLACAAHRHHRAAAAIQRARLCRGNAALWLHLAHRVPPMIAMILREKELLAGSDLSSVEFIRMGSAPVSASLMAAIRQALPQASVTNAYGTTEAGPVVFGHIRRASRSRSYRSDTRIPKCSCGWWRGRTATPMRACSR